MSEFLTADRGETHTLNPIGHLISQPRLVFSHWGKLAFLLGFNNT